MVTLLSETHFWTLRNDIRVKDTDFGTLKYVTKKDFNSNDMVSCTKRKYLEKRNNNVILSNKKSTTLKDNIKKLDDLLKTQKIIDSDWHDAFSVRLMISNGLIIYLRIDIYTGNLCKIMFDNYFINKLAYETISNAVFNRQYILLGYNRNQITMVYLQNSTVRKSSLEKISNMDPKIYHVLIPGPSDKNLIRHIVVNNCCDLMIIWTSSSQSEIYPWRPTTRDQDRANIHVYKLRSIKVELIAYCWTENNPLCVEFLRSSDDYVLTLEQNLYKSYGWTIEICTYRIDNSRMKRNLLMTISVGIQISCFSFSPDQEKLMFGTIDKNVYIYDIHRKMAKFTTKADIILNHCVWHPDSSIILIANNRSQFQCFDTTLSLICTQLTSEDVTPLNFLDLSHYFTEKQNLLKISFSPKPHINTLSYVPYATTDCYLFMLFENGPIGCLRYFSGTGISGDIHNSGLTIDVLIGKYLSINQIEKAINLLFTLNWDTHGAICLISLYQIANYIFCKNDIRYNQSKLLNKALLSFTHDVSDETRDEFEDSVINLKRKYFFFLLRHHLYKDAFEIAENIREYDLFMDLFNITKHDTKLLTFAKKSYEQAELILNQINFIKTNSNKQHDKLESSELINQCTKSINSNRKNSSVMFLEKDLSSNLNFKASNSSEYFGHQMNENLQNLQLKKVNKNNNTPQLLHFKSTLLNHEDIIINIPKPELITNKILLPVEKGGAISKQPQRISPSSSSSSPQHLQVIRANSAPSIDISNQNYHKRKNYLPQHNLKSDTLIDNPDQTLGIPIADISYNNQSVVKNQTSNNNQYDFTSKLQCEHLENQSNIIELESETYNQNFTKKHSMSILSSSNNLHNNGNYKNKSSNVGDTCVKKDSGEKNKVKFSDTVHVAVVPEIPRKDKLLHSRRNAFKLLDIDPVKELADSLPLCHPNDEYLKDFNPVSKNLTETNNKTESNEEQESSDVNGSTIKVVHFGVI